VPTSPKKSAAALSSHKAKSPSARRSPTPPPPETRKSTRDGKFYFIQPEYEYFRQYSQFLLDEDPTMSTSALLQAMHKKVRNCVYRTTLLKILTLLLVADATSFACILAGEGIDEIESAT
jgi:hypothetical protein